MEAARPTTLYLLCGKIAAGKSTLAKRLAAQPATLLIAQDDWMSVLFPTENRTIDDFARLSARLRAAMGPHVVDILRLSLSVVLDFPANTVSYRAWMRSLISEAGVAHELHVLDFPDAVCKERLRQQMKAESTRTRSAKPPMICSRAISSLRRRTRPSTSSSTRSEQCSRRVGVGYASPTRPTTPRHD
jgi:predicted kinase